MTGVSERRTRTIHAHLARMLINEVEHLAADEAIAETEGAKRLADMLLRDALRERATDIHLDPQCEGIRVRMRIDGVLFDSIPLSREHGERLIRHFKAISGMDTTVPLRPADSRLSYLLDDKQIDLRLACLPTICGEKLAIRLLERGRVEQRLGDLGLSDEQRQRIEQWLSNTCGMFLVAGPTGTGKTTTLYALLHELKLHERSVVTIEDPVEYQIDGIIQAQVNRKRGLTFARGMRAALRLDPDYLLMGELRDAEAARAAVEAAASGRVLMSTIHSPDAVATVTSLRNFGLADHEIAATLRVVVAQRLVRRLCLRCRKLQKLSDADCQWLTSLNLPIPGEEVWFPEGCDACRHSGYDSRIGVFEIWRPNEADFASILAHADEHSLRRQLMADGLKTLLSDGYAKFTQGITSLAELKLISSGYPTDSGGRDD